jgi:hypothetical protein
MATAVATWSTIRSSRERSPAWGLASSRSATRDGRDRFLQRPGRVGGPTHPFHEVSAFSNARVGDFGGVQPNASNMA